MAKMTTDEAFRFLAQGTMTGKLATVSDDGSPHVVPIWFVVDGDTLIFATGAETTKGRNLRRDPRVSICVDDQRPPYSFVHIRGTVTFSDEPGELLRWSTAIGGRYMGEGRAEEFGRRNAVEGELLVRVTPDKIVAEKDVSD